MEKGLESLRELVVFTSSAGIVFILVGVLATLGFALPPWVALILWFAILMFVAELTDYPSAMNYKVEDRQATPEEIRDAWEIGIANAAGRRVYVRALLIWFITVWQGVALVYLNGVWWWLVLAGFVTCLPIMVLAVYVARMIGRPGKRLMIADLLKEGGLDLYRLTERLRY